jgi:hypothetical protein
VEGGLSVRTRSLWRRLLGAEDVVVKRIEYDMDANAMVAEVRAYRRHHDRCGRCGRRCGRYDGGEGRRR